MSCVGAGWWARIKLACHCTLCLCHWFLIFSNFNILGVFVQLVQKYTSQIWYEKNVCNGYFNTSKICLVFISTIFALKPCNSALNWWDFFSNCSLQSNLFVENNWNYDNFIIADAIWLEEEIKATTCCSPEHKTQGELLVYATQACFSISCVELTWEVVSQLRVEGLVGLAVVDVVSQLDVVSSVLTPARGPGGRVTRVTSELLLRGRHQPHNVLRLVSLVNIALARPQGEVRLCVLRVAVVEVDKKFLKVWDHQFSVVLLTIMTRDNALQAMHAGSEQLLALSYRTLLRLMTKCCLMMDRVL